MANTCTLELTIQGHLATIALKREKQLNAINQELLQELSGVLDELAGNREVRAVILRGEGRAFAAGADISEMATMSPREAEHFARVGQMVFSKLEQLPQPVIGLIHGFALGGGMELAMACDIRLAAQGTKFGQPEVTLGVVPGFGGSQRLPRIVGQGNALRLLLAGDMIDATEAHRIGLVSEVVPAEALIEKGEALAGKLANLAPEALRLVKQAVYEGAELDQSKGLAMEASLFGLTFSTEDQKHGMKAFREKQKPVYTGK